MSRELLGFSVPHTGCSSECPEKAKDSGACRMPERDVKNLQSVTPATSGTTDTAWTFPVRCLMKTLKSTGSARGVCSHPVSLPNEHSLRIDSNGVSSDRLCVHE